MMCGGPVGLSLLLLSVEAEFSFFSELVGWPSRNRTHPTQPFKNPFETQRDHSHRGA
jgi:hypothetical protein